MKLPSKTSVIKNVTVYSAYLIVIWGFYRFLFQLPEQIEELVVKPVLWILPLVFLSRKEGYGLTSLGFTFKNLFPAIYFSLGIGAIFVIEALVANYFKYGGINLGANLGKLPFLTSLGLSFATAVSEEAAFRGYIFSRLSYATKNIWTANIISSLLWMGIHIPIAFFVWKLGIVEALVYLGLTTIFGIGSAFIYSRTQNIFGSILLHVLWEWPIILFR